MFQELLKINIYDYILNNQIMKNYNIEELEKIFKNFKEILEGLKDVEINDKISFDENNKIYVDKGHSLQFVKRWYYGENRDKTYNILNEQLTNYDNFLSIISYILYSYRRTTRHENLYIEVLNFNEKIVKGLKNLYKTYDEKYKLNNEPVKTGELLLKLLKGMIDTIQILNVKLKNSLSLRRN